MSDLQQPAHGPADSIEPPDKDDTTVEEPDAAVDSWEADDSRWIWKQKQKTRISYTLVT